MARLFIYEDAIEVTLPATIFYDKSQLSYSGYGNASDRFAQWIGSGLTYTPGQLEPTNGTLSYFSFNYNGSPLYIVDNANTTISEAVSWSRQYDPSITNNNYSVSQPQKWGRCYRYIRLKEELFSHSISTLHFILIITHAIVKHLK